MLKQKFLRVNLLAFSNFSHFKLFHLSSRAWFPRGRKQSEFVTQENDDIDIKPKSISNSNENFYGIESDVGVININEKPASQRKLTLLLEESIKKDCTETYYEATFGIIRRDTENKVKFHGQYDKYMNSIFPSRKSSQPGKAKCAGIEVISNIFPKKLSEEHINPNKCESDENIDSYCENIGDVNKNICHMQSSKLEVFEKLNENGNDELLLIDNDSKKDDVAYNCNIDNTKQINKEDVSVPQNNMNFIDDLYFSNIIKETSNEENKVKSCVEKDLNFIDECYFQSHVPDPKLVKDDFSFESLMKNESSQAMDIDSYTTQHHDDKLFGMDDHNKSHIVEKKSENICYHSSSNVNINIEKETSSGDIHDSIDKIKNLNIKNFPNSNTYVSNAYKLSITDAQQKHHSNSYFYSDKVTEQSSYSLDKDKTESKFLFSDQFQNSKDSVAEKSTIDDVILHTMENADSNPIKAIHTVNNQSENSQKHETSKTVSCPAENHSVQDKKENKVRDSKMLSAHDFVMKLRKEKKLNHHFMKKGILCSPCEDKKDFKGFRILKDQVPYLGEYTRDEVLNILINSILYSDEDLIVLNKPYSLVVHDSQTTKEDACLSLFLDDLAKELDKKNSSPKLYTVHRLDKETTGCLLLARNEMMSQKLKSLFAQHKILKKYWIITSNVPDPLEGVIDIPIAEGTIGKKSRMVLCPDIPKDMPYKNHCKGGKRAITRYKVIAASGNAAVVEVTPETGIKHQIRVHFGFALDCPILGDHKYSHLTKLAPQKLQADVLQRLHVRQSKVRYIPMHIHAKSILVPEYFDRRNLFVMAPLPEHMQKNLKALKFDIGKK